MVLNGSSGSFAPCRFGAGVSSCSGAVFDDDAVALSSLDLDRDFDDSGTVGGVAEELRPRVGLLGAGATIT